MLVVDDEPVLVEMVAAYLARDGYAALTANTGPDAVASVRANTPDVVVLDLGLPGLDGIEVCRQTRTFSDCYIIMLTARTDEVDKLIGLSVGADDYLTKPFSVRELMARVQSLLRRPRAADRRDPHQQEPARQFGDLRVDPAGREVHLAGTPIPLTRTEFDILATLATHPRQAFTRQQILDEVWDGSRAGDGHVIDVHVAHLRRKLGDDPAAPRYLRTVRGVGYRIGPG